MSWNLCSGVNGGEDSDGGGTGGIGGGGGGGGDSPGARVNGSYSYPPTWSQIRTQVKHMRSAYSQLFVKTPTALEFRYIADDCLRIYFLLCPAQGREATLFYADVNLKPVSFILHMG